jgi:hypothetical protein
VRREAKRCKVGTGGQAEEEGRLSGYLSSALYRTVPDVSVRVVLSRAPCWPRPLVLASQSKCEIVDENE